MMASETAIPLAIRCFGPFEVHVCGTPIPRLRSCKGYWLLALLALRPGSAVERGWLAGLFWPESLETQAAAHLRRTLTDLRQALGTEACRLRSPAPHTLCLDLSGCEVDIHAFDAAISRGDEASLERAVALYRGPLLEGWAEEWAFQERQIREQAYLQALEHLAHHALEREEPQTAARYLRLAVAVDPMQESTHRMLMQALAAGGNHAAATELYRDLRLRLHRELNATPDPETSALFHQIRSAARCRTAASAPRVIGDPSPRFREAIVHNLPTQLTRFIGREREIAEVTEFLASTRLLTLIGAGGCGKTRLAIQVAFNRVEAYPGGVWFVPLAALTDPALVPQTVAAALGMREEPGRPLTSTLADYLHPRTALLLVDNCEHLLTAAAQLAEELLRVCPRLQVLTTSREGLGLLGEQTYRVPSLSLPPIGSDRPDTVLLYEAVQLFAERARLGQPAFRVTARNASAVAQVCQRLDGIPLAIELAAARVRALPVERINERLDDRFRLLTGGSRTALPRHQTLRALIDWSYDLLSEAERTLLLRLSVFAGDWTLEAAEAICAGNNLDESEVLELLTPLIEKSLVQYETRDGDERYRLLETMRQYSRERLLESGQSEAVRRRHVDYYLRLAEELEELEQEEWLERLEREHDNLRAVLDWCQAAEDGAEAGLRLATRLRGFWGVRGYWSEGRERLVGLLALTGAAAHTAARAQALNAAGLLAWRQSDLEVAHALHEESLAICQELDDGHGIASALSGLGLVVRGQGDYAAARRLFEEALAINCALCNQHGQAANLHWLGYVAVAEGDYAGAKTFFEEALAIYQEIGHRGGASFRALGELALMQGDYAAARQIFEDLLRTARQLKCKLESARCLKGLGDVAHGQGDCETAKALYAESLTLCGELGFKPGIAWLLQEFASRASARGQPERAARLLGAADLLLATLGARFEPTLWHPSDRNVSAIQARMGEEAFAAAWAEGRALSLAEAISYALELAQLED
jgi:predicted ATPase/DNA-binding SARP family transcriptional activator